MAQLARTHEEVLLRLAAQHAVAQALVEAPALPEAAPRVLRAIGETLGWDFGALWEANPDTGELRAVSTWSGAIDAREFAAATTRIRLRPGVGLPGRVYESGAPAWISDFSGETQFPRAAAAGEAGLQGALAFPIRGARGLVGVIEFFAREPRGPDEELLRLMETFGTQLGLYMERKRAEEAVQSAVALRSAILDAALDAIIAIDEDGHVLEFNPAATEIFGYGREEALGRELAELIVPPSLREQHRAALARYVETRAPRILGRRVELTAMDAGGREFPVELTVLAIPGTEPPRFTAYLRDITEHKRRLESAAFLAEASRLLASSLDYNVTLQSIARAAVPAVADWCAVDVVDDAGRLMRVAVTHVDSESESLLRDLHRRFPLEPTTEEAAPAAIRTGEPRLYRTVDDELLGRIATHPDHLGALRELAPCSAVVVPMPGGGRTLGAITLISSTSGRVFDEFHLSLASELAARAGAAVENALLYRERSEIAVTLQRSLLPPTLPEIEGLDLAARFLPAGTGGAIGGDFYDIFAARTGCWALVIGDVQGKGPAAATITALARHTLRAATIGTPKPSEALAVLNEAIIRDEERSRFCTAAYALLSQDDDAVRVDLCCGGHPRPIVLGRAGEARFVGSYGTLLGIVRDVRLDDVSFELAPGETLVLYTDGLVDAQAPARSLDDQTLLELVSGCVGRDAEAVAARLMQAAVGEGDTPPRDDIAILVAAVAGG